MELRIPSARTNCFCEKIYLVNYLDREDEYKPEPEEPPKEFNIIHIESSTKAAPLDDGGIWIG